MEVLTGNIIQLNQRMFICIFAIIVSLSMVVSTDQGYDSDDVDMNDFKTLWDVYIFPRLQLDLSRKVSQWMDEHESSPESLNYNFLNELSNLDRNEQSRPRIKRLGVAGLENLDMLTKTLDRNRLPMSVNMNTNSLRTLMRQVGRRRK